MKLQLKNLFAAFTAVTLFVLMAAAPAAAQTDDSKEPSAADAGTNNIRAERRSFSVTITNLTRSQIFSPPALVTHNDTIRLWEVGQPAIFQLQRIAEEGNHGPFFSALVTPNLGRTAVNTFFDARSGISLQPTTEQTINITADAAHPLLTTVWMLVRTNDGFSGVNALNLFEIARGESVTLETASFDAGTERNNERSGFLIDLQGTRRDPEGGVVTTPHSGIRGDRDAPSSWNFSDPVGRVTITRTR